MSIAAIVLSQFYWQVALLSQQQQQQYLFAIGGWKPGHKPIKAGSKKK